MDNISITQEIKDTYAKETTKETIVDITDVSDDTPVFGVYNEED